MYKTLGTISSYYSIKEINDDIWPEQIPHGKYVEWNMDKKHKWLKIYLMESDLEESNLKIPKGFMEGMIRLSGGAGQTSAHNLILK